MTNHATLVGDYVAAKIASLCRDHRANAATLARLRRGIGRAPGDMPELWDATLKDLPEALMSQDGTPTRGEWAVYTALTLFALHQQGKDSKTERMSVNEGSFGESMRRLAIALDDEDRAKRRFDMVATSDDIVELSHHMRGVVQLLKASGIALNYPALAKDLFWYQYRGSAPAVRLRWGQDFYRVYTQNETADEGKDG